MKKLSLLALFLILVSAAIAVFHYTDSEEIVAYPYPIIQTNLQLSDKLAWHGGAGSVALAQLALRLNIDGLETDIYYVNGELALGHDPEDLQGLLMDTILANIDHDKLAFLWLDMKNISTDNKNGILENLERLNNQYALKEKVLVESQNFADLDVFTESGWCSSYYLTKKLSAEQIITRVNEYNLCAVSYPYKMDNFIRKKVMPQLNDDVRYYTWAEVRFEDDDLFEELGDISHLEKVLIHMSQYAPEQLQP